MGSQPPLPVVLPSKTNTRVFFFFKGVKSKTKCLRSLYRVKLSITPRVCFIILKGKCRCLSSTSSFVRSKQVVRPATRVTPVFVFCFLYTPLSTPLVRSTDRSIGSKGGPLCHRTRRPAALRRPPPDAPSGLRGGGLEPPVHHRDRHLVRGAADKGAPGPGGHGEADGGGVADQHHVGQGGVRDETAWRQRRGWFAAVRCASLAFLSPSPFWFCVTWIDIPSSEGGALFPSPRFENEVSRQRFDSSKAVSTSAPATRTARGC